MIEVQGWDFRVELCMNNHKPRLMHQNWNSEKVTWETREEKDIPHDWISTYQNYEKDINPSNRFWK